MNSCQLTSEQQNVSVATPLLMPLLQCPHGPPVPQIKKKYEIQHVVYQLKSMLGGSVFLLRQYRLLLELQR